MNENNITNINATADGQPVIVIDGKAYPIGYSTNTCTATAADIRKGKTAAVQSGVVTGTLEISGGGGGSFAKVTVFTAPQDAYSAVSSIQVSGFGMAETWDGDIDYSDWNGTYEVTADTASENDVNKRIFKHTSAEKYLYRMWCYDNGEYYWVFDTGTSIEYLYECYFYNYSFESGSWYNYEYEFEVDVDINKVNTQYPAKPLVLEAVSATYSNGAWSFGSAISLTEYDVAPITNGIYMYSDSKLVGDAVDYDYQKWMPTNGLISYFPMSGNAVAAADYVSRIKLFPRGDGVQSGADAWYGNSKGGSLVGTFSTVPKEFTLCLKFRMDDWAGGYEHELPLLQYEAGFGIFVRSNNKVRTLVENEWAEEFDMDRETDYTVFLLYDGDNVRTYCTYNGGELWHNNVRSGYNPPDPFAWQVMSLGYPEHMTITGKIWDIMLYNRVLTDDEIAIIANHN